MQEARKRRTAVKFYRQSTVYTAGAGASTSWVPITVRIGTNRDGTPMTTDTFYAEWLASYGATAIQRQAEGAIRPARVRMTYVPVVYEALISEDVKIYLHGIVDDAHCFRLASACADYMEERRMLEFQVRKREEK